MYAIGSVYYWPLKEWGDGDLNQVDFSVELHDPLMRKPYSYGPLPVPK